MASKLSRPLCDRYLALLGVDVRRPDERSLARLLEHHHERIPVENMSAILARQQAELERTPAALVPDPSRFVESATRQGSGDTGLGLAIALRALLEGLGFEAFLMTADPAGGGLHLAVGVRLGRATYLCDVASGAPSRWPMPLELDGPARAYDAGYCKLRIEIDGPVYALHAAWGPTPEQLVYRLRPDPVPEPLAASMAGETLRTSTKLLEHLSARRCGKNGSVYAFDRSLEVRTLSGAMKDKLETVESFADAVQAQLGIDRDYVLAAHRALKAHGKDPFEGGPAVPW